MLLYVSLDHKKAKYQRCVIKRGSQFRVQSYQWKKYQLLVMLQIVTVITISIWRVATFVLAKPLTWNTNKVFSSLRAAVLFFHRSSDGLVFNHRTLAATSFYETYEISLLLTNMIDLLFLFNINSMNSCKVC